MLSDRILKLARVFKDIRDGLPKDPQGRELFQLDHREVFLMHRYELRGVSSEQSEEMKAEWVENKPLYDVIKNLAELTLPVELQTKIDPPSAEGA